MEHPGQPTEPEARPQADLVLAVPHGDQGVPPRKASAARTAVSND